MLKEAVKDRSSPSMAEIEKLENGHPDKKWLYMGNLRDGAYTNWSA